MQKTVFVDIETTDLDPQTAEPIQIAAIAVNSKTLEPVEQFEVKIQFDVYAANKKALERNCYTPEGWAKALVNVEAIRLFTFFLEKHATWERTSQKGTNYVTTELAGHNIALYDGPLLMAWYKRLDQFLPAAAWVTGPIDTMQMARAIAWARGEDWGRFRLDDLCARFKIPLKHAHDAMDDVMATVELARHLRTFVMLPKLQTISFPGG